MRPVFMSESSEVSGEHVSGQLEVFESVEGDVSVVHHSKHHGNVSTLDSQQFDSSQVWHRSAKAEVTIRENHIMLSVLKETRKDSSHDV